MAGSTGGAASGEDGRLPAALVLAAAGLFPLLAALRHLDDNSLVSWAWVLEGRDVVGLWVLHLGVVGAAVALSRLVLPERLRLPALALCAFLAGLALRWEPEAVIDAARYFVQAKSLELGGVAGFFGSWGREVPAWTDLPLAPLLYGLLFRLLGEHRAVVQLFTAGLFALTVLATAGIGRLLWDAESGACGGLLLLAAPCVLLQVPLLLVDLPAMCAVTLALWGLLAVAERATPARTLLAAGAVGAALLVKYSTWVLLAAAVAAVAGRETLRRRPAAAARAVAAAVVGAAPLAAFALLEPALVARQLALIRGFQWEGLRRWGESYPSTFLFQVHPLLAALAALALWRAARGRDARALVAAAVPLVLFALQVRRSRYLLPAIPMIALLAARGLGALGGARARRFAALSAVGFSLVTVFALDLPFLRWVNTANLAEAGRWLDARGVRVAEVTVAPSPGVLINPEVAVPLLDYETDARVLLAGSAAARPPEQELSTSSTRFTWEQPLPGWYHEPNRGAPGAAQVLVTGDPDAPLPAGLAARVGARPPDAAFVRDAVFRFRTLVYVWLP
jgi:hypothetical protein